MTSKQHRTTTEPRRVAGTTAARVGRARTALAVAALGLTALVVAACSSSPETTTAPGTTEQTAPERATGDGPTTPRHDGRAAPAAQRVEVRDRRPHDRAAFTQGLERSGDVLFESTGQYGRSSLRELDPVTGEVMRQVALDSELFGEGLTVVGDRLIQLTWKAGVALVYDAATLELVDRFRYEGQGWGLCLDDDRLVMSDGSDRLSFRDPETFEEVGEVLVIREGEPQRSLNELECVDGHVYANVYQADEIVEIDLDDGTVVASVDASGLLTDEELSGSNVLNGIAYDREAGTFLITGKYWPVLLEVTFVPA